MAVCPPENSNTALNYDLLSTANYSLSKEDRERLIDAIWDNFIAEEHRSFADEMVAAANPGSLKQVYNGFQSVPTPYNHGYEIVVWNSSGTISSAWYREDYRRDHFMKNRDIHIVLAFPENIADLVGSGSLKIELEVDIRQKEGWVEEVQYSEGTPYKAFYEKKTWAEAEAQCQNKGGHLASVLSEWEDREVKGEMSTSSYHWIGGQMDINGNQSWSDGSHPTFTRWNPWVANSPPHCSQLAGREVSSLWNKASCEFLNHFICRLPAKRVNTTYLKLEYKKEQLNFSSFQVWYKYRTTTKYLLDTWSGAEKRITGFELHWMIENKFEPLEMIVEN